MADQAFEEPRESFSVGERLQKAREAKGMSLEDLATRTRIPIRHLQHIEREEWDALPAVTYCIGFVRAYANAVDLDGDELGREVRDQLGGLRNRAPAAEYYQPADPARVPPRSLALIAALIGLVLIAGYMIWRSSLSDEDAGSVTVTVPEAKAPAAEAGPGAAAPLQPQTAAGQSVTLVATAEVWVRITDGESSLFEGIMAPGQRFSVPTTAQAPVIRTGRPQVLRATVGARDLGPLEPVERTVSNVSLRAEDLAARLQPTGAPLRDAPPRPQLTPIPPQ